MIKVLISHQGRATDEFVQADNQREITIGRAPGCLVRLDEPAVSRLHALLRYDQGQWIIEKRTTSGSVLLNGQEIENAVLQGGEEIGIGDFTLRVEFDQGTSATTGPQFSQDDGRTRILGGGSAQGLFRFEPGAANVAEFQMQEAHAVFGRASNCDVVLLDKKASRKHLEIRREGLSFYLKDLNSANGTLVNDRKLTEEVELVPGDIIQVGEAKFQFSIENKDFFAQRDQFMPVPSELGDSGEEPVDNFAEVPGGFSPPPTDFEPHPETPAEEPEKSLFKRLWKKYRALPTTYRYAIIFFTMIAIITLFPDEQKPTKKPTVSPPAKRDAEGRLVRTFEQLSEDKKEFVRKNYKDLVDAQQKRDYRRMLDLITKLNAVVDEYRDLKAYETIAKRGIEEDEKKEREKQENEKKEAIRREVAELEEKGKGIFAKAMKDPSMRPELTSIVQEIYGKDPNNRLAQEWTSAIKDKEATEEQEREQQKQKQAAKQKADKELAAVEAIFKDGRYREALVASDKLVEQGYAEDDYQARVADLQNRIREKLSSLIDPILKDADAQRGENGDLVKANELYMSVLKIDAQNKPAIKGLESIRETLHTRARRLYSLGVLSESISDLADAKDKFAKCLRTAPEDDIYKERCRNKISRYEVYQGHD